MNKEKAETLLENYQALSELYSNTRKELERTRKALDVAVDALETYADQEYWDDGAGDIEARIALKKIKQLIKEQ